MCNCKAEVARKAQGGHVVVFSEIERYGYSIIRIKPYRLSDGQPSKVNHYAGADWRFCPFCGQPLGKRKER